MQLPCPNSHFCYQTCLNKGKFPTALEISEVIPLQKDGNKRQKRTNRRINLLSNVSKITERIVFDDLYEYVSSKLFDSQFDFCKDGSAVIQLLLYLEDTYEHLDEAFRKLSVLYLDFEKAFHCVPYQKLVDKLFALGIGGTAFRLIKKSHLFQRKQQVRIND